MDSIATANEQVSLRWLSTIRARGGIALQDRVLLYATGGLAVGGVNSQGSVITEPGMPGAVIWNGSNSTVKAGYVVGGGIEWAFYDRWTAKAEYLWYNLGNVSHPLNFSSENGVAPCGTDVYPTLGSTSSSVFGSIVRVGVNYKFGGP
jgi:outer membrane immunogenic protein